MHKNSPLPLHRATDAPKFASAKTLALALGVHPKTIFRWANAKLIHRHKLNARVVLFDEQEVVALIKRSRIE